MDSRFFEIDDAVLDMIECEIRRVMAEGEDLGKKALSFLSSIREGKPSSVLSRVFLDRELVLISRGSLPTCTVEDDDGEDETPPKRCSRELNDDDV